MAYPTRYKWLPGPRFLLLDVALGTVFVLTTVVLPLVIIWVAMTEGN
jgi:hypothetical protein